MQTETVDYYNGYNAYPDRRLYPQAGTVAEGNYLRGWHQAAREAQCDNSEWEFGRDTFAVAYFKEAKIIEKS